jgi:hypothetical protein
MDQTRRDIDYNHDFGHDIRRLQQAPIALLGGWLEVWRGYTQAAHAMFNVMSEAMHSNVRHITNTIDEVRDQADQRRPIGTGPSAKP